LQFFETLHVEVGDTIGITIVIPGMIESEIAKGKFLSDDGELSVKPPDQRDVSVLSFMKP
jgi:short-subunit dehydrogenase